MSEPGGSSSERHSDESKHSANATLFLALNKGQSLNASPPESIFRLSQASGEKGWPRSPEPDGTKPKDGIRDACRVFVNANLNKQFA